jgi:hypothetical protein
VVKWVANGTACKVQGQDRNVTEPDNGLAKSASRGASWSLLANQSLFFSVYGTVATASDPQVQETHYLGGTDVTLRVGNDAQATVQTGVQLLNRPEASP